MRLAALSLMVVILIPACRVHQSDVGSAGRPAPRLLIFSKTAGFRHESIPAGVSALQTLLAKRGWAADATENSEVFNAQRLTTYHAIVFLNTSGDVLTDPQQDAMECFVKAGGGFVGIHAAADTEPDWDWYGTLVGARFASHPAVQSATIVIDRPHHESTRMLPKTWRRTDEWYNFDSHPRTRLGESLSVLMSVDESSYTGGSMGSEHPIAWCHEFEGGRAWYTGCGHTLESYAEPEFLGHVLGGIEWAVQSEPNNWIRD